MSRKIEKKRRFSFWKRCSKHLLQNHKNQGYREQFDTLFDANRVFFLTFSRRRLPSFPFCLAEFPVCCRRVSQTAW